MRNRAAVLACATLCAAVAAGCGGGGASETCVSKLAVDTEGDELGVNQTSLGKDDIAQSFSPVTGASVTTVALQLFKEGEPGGTLTLTLEGDSAGTPDGAPVATAELSIASITNPNPAFYTFTFASAATLTAGETYWLRLGASYGASDDNLVLWSGNDGDAFSRGSAAYFNFTTQTWSTDGIGANRDLLFKVGCTTP